MKEIDVSTLATLMEDAQVFLVDVRSPIEYAAGHIDGSINVPLEDIGDHFSEVTGHGDVYLICRSGGRSSFAQQALAIGGIESTYNVVGGMMAWTEAGLPIVGTFSP